MIDRSAAIEIARARAVQNGWAFGEPLAVVHRRGWFGQHDRFEIETNAGMLGTKAQQGAQPFSPAPHNVAGDQGDEGHTGLEILVDLFLDALQIFIQLGEKRILLLNQIFCGTLEGQC